MYTLRNIELEYLPGAALKGRQVSEGTLNRLRTVSCLKVEVKDLETNKIEYYPSVTLAAKAIGSNRSSQRVPTPPSPRGGGSGLGEVSRFIKANKVYRGKSLFKFV